jgi:hypothetical protein
MNFAHHLQEIRKAPGLLGLRQTPNCPSLPQVPPFGTTGSNAKSLTILRTEGDYRETLVQRA